ncbi:hypothetical protein V3N99_08070 [Dermatophilaceae bacterium Soc4.6]
MDAMTVAAPLGAPEVGPAEKNATHWLVRSLALLRVAQVVPALVPLFAAPQSYRSYPATICVFALAVAWNVSLFWSALRRGWFTLSWMLADAGLQAVLAVVVGLLCADGQATQTANWSLGPVIGAAILASLFLGRSAMAAVTGMLIAGYLIGASRDFSEHWPDAMSNVGFLAAFAWAGFMVGQRLLSDGRAADAATREASAAEAARARSEARYDERARQYQRLHDTVLSTLEGISRGGLDYAEDSVRRRCSSDANLVRSLNAAVDDATELSPLPVVLAEVVHEVEAFGLKVHSFTDAVPHALPAHVVDAAAGAVREALNNVVKHAGVREAWVWSVGDETGGIRIRVTDRGTGFDPGQVAADGGVEGSIRRRWTAVDGTLSIDSDSMGTMVELAWTP